jgi:hypothetical protein
MAWDDSANPAGSQGSSWYCEDASSRDTYAGTTFGLLTALDIVGPFDSQIKRMAGNDLMLMTSYLLRHGWSVVRPHTRISTGGSENFIFPLFVINPDSRLNMAQSARRAAQVVGTPVQKAFFEAAWTEELATQGPLLLGDSLLGAENLASYYPQNLAHLTGFNTIREEKNPVVSALLRQSFSIIDATTNDDLNAHFEAITYALTGDTWRRDNAVRHLFDWMAYRDKPEQTVTNSTRCGHDLTCIPDDTVIMRPTKLSAFTIELPGILGDPLSVTDPPSTTLRSTTPLPIAQRVPHEDFLWQRSPWKLDGGGSPYEREPGVDFLTPYWMLRYYSEVAPPPHKPFPAWPGPTFS